MDDTEYEYVSIGAHWTSEGIRTRTKSDWRLRDTQRRFGISLTCKQVAVETLPMLYSSTFNLRSLNELYLFMLAIGKNIRFLQHLRVLPKKRDCQWALSQGRHVFEKLACSAVNLRGLFFALEKLRWRIDNDILRNLKRDMAPLARTQVRITTDLERANIFSL